MVLLSREKVHGVAREAIVYHKGLDNEARVRLATSWGASAANLRNIVKACGTDLRQLQLAATFGSGGTDSAAHVWMDTRAILSGAPKSTDYYSVDWLEHNVLESLAPSQLDGAAAFYGSLALADSLGNGGNGFLLGNEREDYGRQILKHSLAVNKLTLFRKSVQAPPARRPELQHNPRKWQKEMHAIHGNGATGAEGAATSRRSKAVPFANVAIGAEGAAPRQKR